MMDYTKPIQYNKNPITSNRKLKRAGRKTFWSLFCPLLMVLIAVFMSNVIGGSHLFIGSDGHGTLINVMSIIKASVLVLIAALALNTNLNSGRMDFSLGATGILAVLLASLIVPGFDSAEHIFEFVLLSIVFGMIIGFIHSIILFFTKLPPIVISLGMCLIYEGIAYVISKSVYGSTQVNISTGSYSASNFFMEPIVIIPIAIIVCLLMAAALCYTRFGYNKLALVYNQKISVDTGIDEFLHCVVSFIIAGALIALYQVISSCGSQITMNVDLGSSGTVFKNFLPIFIGGILAKYNNQIVGLLLAVLGVTILYSYGFDAVNMSSTTSALINGFSVFAVLVYMVDKYRFINWIKMRKYLRKEKYLNPKEVK